MKSKALASRCVLCPQRTVTAALAYSRAFVFRSPPNEETGTGQIVC